MNGYNSFVEEASFCSCCSWQSGVYTQWCSSEPKSLSLKKAVHPAECSSYESKAHTETRVARTLNPFKLKNGWDFKLTRVDLKAMLDHPRCSTSSILRSSNAFEFLFNLITLSCLFFFLNNLGIIFVALSCKEGFEKKLMLIDSNYLSNKCQL